MRSAVFALTLMSAVVLSQINSAFAQESGAGRLDIVFSEVEFSLSLSVPVKDILGIEKPVENDEGRNSIAVAISDLSKPLEVFVVPDEAGCFTAIANVTLSAIRLGQETGAAQGDQESQSDFQAEYLIQCQNIDAIKVMRIGYFERFPQAEKLVVRVERSGQSSSHVLTRTTPELSL